MPKRTSGYVLAIIFAFTAALSFADKPAPRVKVEIEVTVYEDGDVEIRRASKKPKESVKKKYRGQDSMPCCSEMSCKMCRKKNANINPAKTKMKKQVDAIRTISKSLMSLDKNEDGRLNADEVAPRLKSPFSQVDLNGDGYLDAGEIRRQIKNKMKAS
ncbi:MAG: hypothetical protein P8M53_11520 [Pirellulales bacterium]|jgi:hypothetical protein|nr:hypothetical protein [Pirellulales bacterium]